MATSPHRTIASERAAARDERASNRHAEARKRLAQLAERHPDNSRVLFELACVEDYLGHSRAAIEHYNTALALGISKPLSRDTYVGLGSTLRAVGRYAEALSVFDKALEIFPRAQEIVLFRAMTLHNLGQKDEAFRIVLSLLAKTSANRDLVAFKRAISFYSKDISRVWPEKV